MPLINLLTVTVAFGMINKVISGAYFDNMKK